MKPSAVVEPLLTTTFDALLFQHISKAASRLFNNVMLSAGKFIILFFSIFCRKASLLIQERRSEGEAVFLTSPGL